MSLAQGYVTSYSPRLRQYGNALLAPVIAPTQVAPPSRTTKRGTVAVNYAEDGYDDEDLEDGEGLRRPTGLRSLKRDESTTDKLPMLEKLGKEIQAPVEVQGIFRDWVMKRKLKPSTVQQMHIQSQLPLTLVPIRIDLEIPAHQPQEPFPLPRNHLEAGVNPALAAYRKPDPVPSYRVKDTFLWNLHEALTTPDEFATALIRDLDLPNSQAMMMSVSNQIRQQLEEYAGVALHPLFQNAQAKVSSTTGGVPANRFGSPRDIFMMSAASETSTPATNGVRKSGEFSTTAEGPQEVDIILNPDDAYRCIINLNINLQNKLYTDKFEWSLLHPPGMAEEFARVTCGDLGLGGEWVSAISHGIYESVLKLKKEACESGGLITGIRGQGNEIDNQAVNGQEAGWRYDPEGLADEWEPKVEALSKEEIERREGDRERQIRRLRRETARFSSTTGMTPEVTRQSSGNYFDIPDNSETPMGRGERSKRKRRYRSASPTNRGGTSGGRGTPETGAGAGYGGAGGALSDWERQTWRCANCAVWGSAVWAVRDGPSGAKTLCHNCGLLYERDKVPPIWSKDLHGHDAPIGR